MLICDRHHSYPADKDAEPNFNLTVAEDTGNRLPFRVTGTSDLEDNPLDTVQMNMSTCSRSEGWWGVSGITVDDRRDYYVTRSGVTNPTMQLTFDESSASLSIRTWIIANTLSEEDEKTPRISSMLTIDFLGKIDSARSDILNERNPVTWTPSVGFGNNSLNLDFRSGAIAAVRVNMCKIWSILGAIVLANMFLVY